MPLKGKRNETLEHQSSPARDDAKHTSANHAPNHDDIRCRAYEIYLERGSAPGRELEDWLQAESEIGSATLYIRTRKGATQQA
jgi:hypothetical protein